MQVKFSPLYDMQGNENGVSVHRVRNDELITIGYIYAEKGSVHKFYPVKQACFPPRELEIIASKIQDIIDKIKELNDSSKAKKRTKKGGKVLNEELHS